MISANIVKILDFIYSYNPVLASEYFFNSVENRSNFWHLGSAHTILSLSWRKERVVVIVRHFVPMENVNSKVMEENTSLQTEAGVQLQRRLIDLWPLVESLLHDLQPVAKTSGAQLTNGVPHELVVFADASLLRRIFQNLVANAIAHSPGGEVIVTATESAAERAIVCTVRDNGAGIPTDRLEKVFDKFESDHQSAENLGLGLMIVKTFVEAHGGTVTVKSTMGSGTEFQFTLPDN